MIYQIFSFIKKFSTEMTDKYETLIKNHSNVFSTILTHDAVEFSQDIIEDDTGDDIDDYECDRVMFVTDWLQTTAEDAS